MRQRTFVKSPAPAIIAMSLLHLGFLDQPFRSEQCLTNISNNVNFHILIHKQQCIKVGHHPKGSDIGSSIFELLQVDQVQVLMITNAFEQGNWG